MTARLSEELVVHYESAGNGDTTVLFVPGWTMTSEVFTEQLAFFRDSPRYRFVTYDPRAHGRSSPSGSGHFFEQHGRDLHAFMETLALDNVMLGGWSAACLTVLSYIEQYGSARLSGLILIDGAPRWRGPDNHAYWVNYRYDDADGFEEMFTMGPLRDRAGFNRKLAEWMLEDASPERVAWINEVTNQTPDAVAALLNASGCFLDYRDTLAGLDGSLPLLYVVREAKQDVVADWARAHTPSARVEAFGHHMMFYERADRFNEVLMEFLAPIS